MATIPTEAYTRADLDRAISLIGEPPAFEGRGIVISAGGKFIPSMYVAVRSIRHFGCALPIEIWHLGPGEIVPCLDAVLEPYGVTLIDSLKVAAEKGIDPPRNGWVNKFFSLIHSNLAETIFVDADNMALQNLDALFESERYQRFGHQVWPDFKVEVDSKWAIKPEAWAMLGLPDRRYAELETGQMAFDKRRVWKPLAVAGHMNFDTTYYYDRCSWGDKDTCTLAWDYLGLELNTMPHRPEMTCAPVRLHFDENGVPLFQHTYKWTIPAEANRVEPSLRLASQALGWLEEFRVEFQTAERNARL